MSVILLASVHLAIHIPSVQNYIAHTIAKKVDPHINGKLTFDKLTISFFNRIVIQNFSITGAPGDTMVSAEKLAVYISLKDLLQTNMKVNRISIRNGVFNYIEEGPNKESNVDRILKSDPKKEKKSSGWPHLTIRELRIQNYRFNYKDFRDPIHPVYPGGMDYTDIQVFDINLRAYDLKTRPKKGITAKIHSLKAKEKSGLILRNLTSDFSLDKHATTFKNLRLQEGWSYVKANYLTFGYRSGKDLKGFVRNIYMDADFTNAFVDFNTIGIYTPYMQNNNLQLYLTGRVHGPVSHLQSSRLKVETPDKRTSIDLAFSMKGLPKIRNTVFDAQIFNITSRSEDIDKFISHFTKKRTRILSPHLPNAKIRLSGNMLGTLYDFAADGDLKTSMGNLNFDVTSVIKGKVEGARIKGSANTQNIELGKILKVNNLGKLTANVKADVQIKKPQYGGLSMDIESLNIDQLGFKGYDYTNIFALGKYSNETFDGRVISHDPNLDLMFQGVATLSDITDNSIYKFYADIPYIDLSALNLIKTEKSAQLSLRTVANITSKNNELVGNVDVKNITYWGDEEYKFNSISLSSIKQIDNHQIELAAPFLNAQYTSSISPKSFISKFKEVVLARQFKNTLIKTEPQTDSITTNGTTEFNLKLYDTEDILNILMPQVYIADSTSIAVTMDERDSIGINIKSDRIALGNNSLKDFNLDFSTSDSTIVSNIQSSTMTIAGLNLQDNSIDILSEDGKVIICCQLDKEKENSEEILLNTVVSFERDEADKLKTNLDINSSHIQLKGYRWDLDSTALSLSKRNFSFDNFKLRQDDQFIYIDGTISEDETDSINIDLNNFDLAIVESMIKKSIGIGGTLSGSVNASNIYNTPSILLDITGNDISLKSRTVGSLRMLSKWDQARNRMNILVQNHNEGLNPLTLSGYYQPSGKYFNLNIGLKEFSLTAIEPFVKGALINTGGVISGDLELVGTSRNLTLTSDNTRIHNFSFTPAYTQVPYVVSGDLVLDTDGVHFNTLKVQDKFNNEGRLSGHLRHKSFREMYLDASLSFDNLQCLNTSEKDNQSFYGSAYASGSINLTGPLNNLFADVNATTGARTAIHIPLSSAASAKNDQLLTFKSNQKIVLDPYLERMKKLNKKREENNSSKSNFALQAKANITSDAELFIEINKQLGDILRCTGNGVIDINMDPSKSLLDLKGDYTIEEGSYKFVLLGITAKDFTIDNGGSINFNGNIKQTSLNVGATYQTKASVSTLIADTSAVGNRRTVDCGIKMSGSLSDPNITFSVDVKDLDPITKGRVESALSTDDKIQKQFMALILSGSFIPDEQSGIFNNSTILYSNAGEMLSNQVNNVFRQLDIPLDLGFNFQPATDGKTQDMFDVALSYQAFNNRVIINGNVGNNQVSQSWGGDFEAEVKLDKRGKMRIKAFTRSPDDYSNYLDNTQRHGIGFTYQDEFDTFKELLRNIFWSKKRKEEYETKLMLEAEKKLQEEQAK